jgi:hypothetical protein
MLICAMRMRSQAAVKSPSASGGTSNAMMTAASDSTMSLSVRLARRGASMAWILDYDFHPPDELRVFPMPASGVRRLDDDAFVAEVRSQGRFRRAIRRACRVR